MAKLILSEASQNGIQDVTSKKPKMKRDYKEMMEKADKKIEEDHAQYANAYMNALRVMAR